MSSSCMTTGEQPDDHSVVIPSDGRAPQHSTLGYSGGATRTPGAGALKCLRSIVAVTGLVWSHVQY